LIGDLSRSGVTMGRAYWVNTAGAVAGPILAGFALIPALGLKGALMLVAAAQVLAGWLCLLWTPVPPRRRIAFGAASAVALGLAFAILSRSLAGPSPFDADGGGTLVAHRDGTTASVSVVARPGGVRTLRIDGFEAASADQGAGYMAMMSHIPMLLHPRAERALVVCFGTGTTAGAVLRYPGTKLDVVDINATVFDFADYFLDVNHGVARDPRARLTVDDGRGFLQTTAERYDVITAEPMPPTFAGVVNLYSREYYQLARGRLRPGGLLVQWLPFHLVTAGQAWSILRSVQDVFPETTLWLHRHTGIIVARREGPIVLDLAALRERVAAVRDSLRGVEVPDLEAFVDLYGLGPAAVAELTRGAAAVTDDRPSLEFHPPQHRWEWTLGTFTPDQLKALVAVYSRRARESLPLTGPPTEESRTLGEARAGSSYALLGDAYLDAGDSRLARRTYEQGLGTAGQASQRAIFLFALAQIAEKDGRGREALDLLDRGLLLSPDNAAARLFRTRLTRDAASN
jgi:spermidine synthase